MQNKINNNNNNNNEIQICIDCDLKFKKHISFINHNNYHKKQEQFFDQFNKKSFENIEYINDVPKVVYICWFGGYCKKLPLMSNKRFLAFKSLVENIDIPVILLTYKNYKFFEKKDHPIHKSFEYLSANHKSDYLRAYMLHYYGGGYHDVKWRKESWKNEWEKDNWTKNENIWIYGRKEKYESAIGYPPGMKYIQKEYNKLVTMCWIICKKKTKYTQELINKIEDILDQKYQELNKFPGYKSSGYYSSDPFSPAEENNYPLRWLEIMGEIFHPLMLKYNDKIKFGLKDALKKRYK
jgi:hypothetical protein